MVHTLHVCGFNGFQQISGLSKVCLDGWTTEISTPYKKPARECAVSAPVAVLQLLDPVQVERILFTWSRIAAVLSKDGSTVSVISGGQESHRPVILEQTQALCATESCFLLRQSTATQYELDCLQEGSAQLQPLSITENLQVKPSGRMLLLHSSHTDVYYSGGNDTFGKVQFQACHTIGRLCPQAISLKIKKISCGKEHVLFLSSFGCVYSSGLGSRGQLGHGDVEMEGEPKLIEALEGIPMTEIEAGGWHSVSVSESGDVYSWGWNESGQLGVSSQSCGTRPGLVTEPTCVVLPQEVPVKTVACGSRHSLVMSDCGSVFAAGWNAYGQLGLGHKTNQYTFARVVSLSSPCHQMYAGHWCSVFLCSQ